MRYYAWLLARIGVAIVLVAWAYFALVPDKRGREEFLRSIEALKTVRSIHYSTSADVPTQQTEVQGDLDCSSGRVYRKRHITLNQPNNKGTLDEELVAVGDQEYRRLTSGQWKRDIPTLGPAESICRRLATGSNTWVTTDLNESLQYDIIEKGKKKTVNGEDCREWKVSNPHYSYRSETVCIGITDHLPLEIVNTAYNSHSTFTYNTLIQIDPPTDIVPEPKYDDYRPPPPSLTLSDDNDEIH